jgi:hypothetical protein
VFLVYVAVTYFLVGCDSDAPATPQPLAPCPSESSQIYTGFFYPELRSEEAKNVAERIYAQAPIDMAIAKREALKFLSYETERWSDVKYKSFDPQPRLRFIVSFLTPGLVRAIVLNHLLSTYNPAQVANLEAETGKSLAILDKREEFAFIILIQAEQATTPIEFSVYPSEIQLHTTDGFQVKSTHSDDFLNLPLDTSKNLYSGLFFYPVKVSKNGICDLLLKPGTETSLLLKIDTAKISDQTNVMLDWVIYFPLLYNLIVPMYDVDTITAVQNADDSFETHLDALEVTSFVESSDAIIWRDVGRLIWWKLLLEGVPH